MMKKNKKIIALICAVCLLTTSLVAVLLATGVLTSALGAKSGLPTDFTEVTPREFGIADYTNNSEYYPYRSTNKPITSADKMLLKANVIFGDAWHGFWIFDKSTQSEAQSGYGIGIERGFGASWVRVYHSYHDYTGPIYIGGEFVSGAHTGGTVTDSFFADINLGVDIATTQIEFAVSTEVLDYDHDGAQDDMKIGMWVNGNLVDASHGDNPDGTYLYFLNFDIGASDIALFTNVKSLNSPAVAALPTYTDVTPEMYGIADYTGNTSGQCYASTKAPVSTQDLIRLKANVVFGNTWTGLTLYNSGSTGTPKDGEGIVLLKGWDDTLRLYNYVSAESDRVIYIGGKFVNGVYTGGTKTSALYYDVSTGLDLTTTEVQLAMTTDVVDFDNDGAKDDLRLGIWFGNTMVGGNYYYFLNSQLGENSKYLFSTAMSVSSPEVAPLPEPPAEELPPQDLPAGERVTFSSYNIKNAIYSGNMGDFAGKGFYFPSLEDKVFSGNVKFSPSPAHIFFGAADDIWGGFNIVSTPEGNLKLGFGGSEYILTPAVAGTTLVGEEFNLKLSYQVVDKNGDGTKDALKLGVWIENVLYNNQYFYATNFTDYNGVPRDYTYYLNGWIAFVMEEATSSIEISSDTPQVLDSKLEKVTFSDYKIDDGDYGYNAGQDFAKRGSYWESLNGKVFAGDVTISQKKAYLYFGDKEDAADGFYLASGQYDDDVDALQFHLGDKNYKFTPEIAGTALVGEQVNLKISYQVIDKDKDGQNDNLKIGVWFNNVLYNNQYFYVSTYNDGAKDYTYYLKGFCTLKPAVADASISVSSEAPEIPEILNPQLEHITFREFGVSDKTYGYTGDLITGFYKENLAGKVFSGNVKFTTDHTIFYLGGEPNQWYGISLASGVSGYETDKLVLGIGTKQYVIDPDVVGTALVGNTINVKFSYELVDKDQDGTDDQLKFGLWIEGKLYGNKYHYITTYQHPEASYGTRSYTDFLNGYLGMMPATETAKFEVASDLIKQLDASLKEITFKDFGIKDGTYKYAKDFAAKGTYKGTLLNKVFKGDITFSEAPSALYLGGEPDAKSGISIASGQEGVAKDSLLLTIGNKKYTLSPAVIGTVLVGKEINLKVSYQEVDNALQVGIWINGKLYQNSYYTVTDYQDFLSGRMGIAVTGKNASLKVKSDAPETIDKKMEEVTFQEFGLKDGKYNDTTRMQLGWYAGTLANKVFSGDVTFSSTLAGIWIGAQEDPWLGLSLISDYNNDKNTLTFGCGGKDYIIEPKVAGTTLIGKKFNLKISYQMVDNNGDGKEDTLKLGLWFNDRLYNDEYFYVTDYANYLSHYIGIYTPYEGSYLTIESDVVVPNPAKGSRSLSTPPTGDAAEWILYASLATVALVSIVAVLRKKRLE